MASTSLKDWESTAKSLGVPEIPVGAFDFITKPSLSEGTGLLNDWLDEAGISAWGEIMPVDDAKKLAARVFDIAVREGKAQVAKLLENGELIGGALGASVAAAIPIVGWAATAIAFFAKAISSGKKAMDYQVDKMRDGRRTALIAQSVGFDPGGSLVKTLALRGDQHDLFAPRSSVWIPYTGGVVPADSVFEITPALYPAWNPYFPPGPYSPAKGVKSQINDILLGFQQNAWGDPWTIANIRERELLMMKTRVGMLKAGSELSWSGKGGSRKVSADEVELMRRCVGNVVAARAALMADPAAARAVSWTSWDSPVSGPGEGWAESIVSASPDIISSAKTAPGNGSFSINSKALEDFGSKGALGSALGSGSGSGAGLMLLVAGGGLAAYLLTRKK